MLLFCCGWLGLIASSRTGQMACDMAFKLQITCQGLTVTLQHILLDNLANIASEY